MIKNIKTWARKLKKQIITLYFASKDNRVSLHVKVFTACVVAYAFSPIDLIPDFIPILGYLDDVIIVPLGIMLALKMIPRNVIIDCEAQAEELMRNGKPKNWIAGTIIILIWGLVLGWIIFKIYSMFA
ncbi:uncharacterized membrane protein YkvA (DUF1232 family) [Neobacillus sp. B4I6]|uniref:YkvA family protein n=1 Tax=Neobacillus sp. B4I6 TaxID=3373925 RepID=UPI003D23F3D2